MLHQRIKIFRKTPSKIGNYFMSIKWIGNSGSHISGLSKEAVINAYDIMEYSLGLLYNDREQAIETLSDRINKDKGYK